jgi:hypothetical protein
VSLSTITTSAVSSINAVPGSYFTGDITAATFSGYTINQLLNSNVSTVSSLPVSSFSTIFTHTIRNNPQVGFGLSNDLIVTADANVRLETANGNVSINVLSGYDFLIQADAAQFTLTGGGFDVETGEVTFDAASNVNIMSLSTITTSAVSSINAVPASYFTGDIRAATFNGLPLSDGWVSTAASDLDMANYNINNLTSITSAVTTMTLSNTSNISINASNISVGGSINANCNAITNVGDFSRYLISTELPQPVHQYDYVSTMGAFSGTITVTLSQRYTSVNSYIPFAVVQNDATTTFYVSTITRATFEIGWSGFTGFGDIIFSWNTMGV